jgi:hypothetical protein
MTNNNLSIVLCTALCASVATYAVLDIVLPMITIDIKINRNFLSLVGGVAVGIGSLKYFCK